MLLNARRVKTAMASKAGRIAPIILAAVMFVMVVPTGAHAIPADSIRTVSVSSASPLTKRLADRVGVPEDGMLRIQSKGGYTIVVGSNGYEIFESSGLDAIPASVSYGVCSGTFHLISLGTSYLEWGAGSSCTGSPGNAMYIHKLDVQLRHHHGLFWAQKTVLRGNSSTWAPYSTQQWAMEQNGCDSSASVRYDVKVFPMVHSIAFGPFTSAYKNINCSVYGA